MIWLLDLMRLRYHTPGCQQIPVPTDCTQQIRFVQMRASRWSPVGTRRYCHESKDLGCQAVGSCQELCDGYIHIKLAAAFDASRTTHVGIPALPRDVGCKAGLEQVL